MHADAFIAKWRANSRNERAAAQEHFLDLCALLGEPTPNSDPTGATYAFEKGATKASGGEGWADVWRRGRFAWEYKGKHKDLEAAHRQLLQYAGALENPPLLVTSDIERIIIRTNWNDTATETHQILLKDIAKPNGLNVLRAVFSHPDRLKPGKTRTALTADAAADFAELARRLRLRGHDAQVVAHFINRLVFCLFADDVDLLPADLFERMLDASKKSPSRFESYVSRLFAAMAERGGEVDFTPVAWFNGGLFDDARALPLEGDDIILVQRAAALDWAEIDPSILGTLFERGLDPDKRGQLGAHYTSREMIERIIDPVVRRPLLDEWTRVRDELGAILATGAIAKVGSRSKRDALSRASVLFRAFLDRIRAFRVLDPACGSGNFLYLALLALKDLEHDAMVEAEVLGLQREFPQVGPEAVLGLEVNPYAAELARVSVWIGHIQWARSHGYPSPSNPILRKLDTIECRDAVLAEGGGQPTWPEADVIVGNPPFLGSKWMRDVLGSEYTIKLRAAYHDQVPVTADLVAYWFWKAQVAITTSKSHAAGFVATNMIRGTANRRVMNQICATTPVFRDWSDEPWNIDGADVRVSLICFSKERQRSVLDDQDVPQIHADLTAGSADTTTAHALLENVGMAIRGIELGGPFDVSGTVARHWIAAPKNPNGRSNADVLRLSLTGKEFAGRPKDKWIIDFTGMSEKEAAFFELVFDYAQVNIKPARSANNEARTAMNWWLHRRSGTDLRRAIQGLDRFIGTPLVAKHRIFNWIPKGILPDTRIVVIPRDDDVTIGVLSSAYHEKWTLQNCQYHGVGNDPVYTPTSVFYNFPFPEGLSPDVAPSAFESHPHARIIAAAAKDLFEKREMWLNPPDQTVRISDVVAGLPDRVLPKDSKCAETLKSRTLTNLYNARPKWLDNLHRTLDEAVASAYGWPSDLSDDEVLARLLALNHERASR